MTLIEPSISSTRIGKGHQHREVVDVELARLPLAEPAEPDDQEEVDGGGLGRDDRRAGGAGMVEDGAQHDWPNYGRGSGGRGAIDPPVPPRAVAPVRPASAPAPPPLRSPASRPPGPEPRRSAGPRGPS